MDCNQSFDTMNALSNGRPLVALARLFQRTNVRGETYFVGRIGSAKLLVVPTGEISRGEAVWDAVIGPGFYEEKNGTAAAEGIEDEPNGAATASSRKTLSLPAR
jgi:hypothetical protein